MTQKDKFEAIKTETSITWLWHHFGLSGEPGRACRSPFREDKTASFSVWSTAKGEKWRDHGTNETGDVIDFFAKVKGVSTGIALAELAKLRNISSPPVQPKTIYKLSPDFREPTNEECKKLGALRGLDPGAFDISGKLGTLKVGNHPKTNELLYWLTDASGVASEGRTFDGKPCQCSGKKVSALPGSRKDFPIGLKTTNPHYDKLNKVVMVEGSADYFAAMHVAIQVNLNFRVCAMLGASCSLCDEAVPLFEGASVLILEQNDEPGKAASQRWREQISKAINSFVTVFPSDIKDLNDFLLCPIFSSCKEPF